MQQQQKVAVHKIREFPICAETVLSVAASRFKRTLFELAFEDNLSLIQYRRDFIAIIDGHVDLIRYLGLKIVPK